MNFPARYPGKCPCGNAIREGDSVGWIDGEVCCPRCVENGEVYEPPAAPTCPDCHLQHKGECW